MNTIFQNWKQSVTFFRPNLLFDLIYVAIRTYFKALLNLVIHFWWLIAIDMFLFVVFGPAINKMLLVLQNDSMAQPHFLVSFVSLLSAIVSFALSSTLILLIKKQNAIPPVAYVFQNIIRYIHLLLFFSFFLFLGLYILVLGGITNLPSASPIVLFCAKIIELVTLFFWLDLPPRLINIFVAFERAINMFFYRIPFFIVFIAVNMGCDFLSNHIAHKTLCISQPFFFLDKAYVLLGAGPCPMPFVLKALLFGYCVAIVQHFLISILFAFYDETKREVYTESLLGS
jgi:hypothetical protein